ncbi:MAG: tRNA (guanosine(46)-N7)-methyltransferase TrmB [Steroidobacteraceae bacterium]
MTEEHRRSVRSFVVRAGRMTVAQERAWRELWPRYGIEDDGPLDFGTVFGREAPVTLEIGFGNGESLAALAEAHPDRDFLGIEVHRPGVGHLLLRAEAAGLSNVRIVCRDAVEVLERQVADAALAEVLLYFPDPWPKKRHHKRRIVQGAFVDLVARKLQPGGVFRLATDWQDYAEHMLAVVGACEGLRNLSSSGGHAPRPESRPLTRFELRGQRLGHEVWDLAFTRP